MNILIVCLQGLTSGVMAKELTRMAEEKKDPYVFRACSVHNLEESVSWCDICLLTPQVQSFHASIERIASEHHIPVWSMDSLTLSFNTLPETYQRIVERIQPQKETSSTVTHLLIILCMIGICGAGALLLTLFPIPFLLPLKEVTWDCISIYVLLYLFEAYFRKYHLPPATGLTFSLITLFALLPVRFQSDSYSTIYHVLVQNRHLFGILYLPYYLSASLLIFQLCSFLFPRLLKGKKLGSINYLTCGIPYAVILGLLLVIRGILGILF